MTLNWILWHKILLFFFYKLNFLNCTFFSFIKILSVRMFCLFFFPIMFINFFLEPIFQCIIVNLMCNCFYVQVLWSSLPGPFVSAGGLDKAFTEAHHEYRCTAHRGRDGGSHLPQGLLPQHHHSTTGTTFSDANILMSLRTHYLSFEYHLYVNCLVPVLSLYRHQ